ncbi:MAG: hypothetical protein DVB32_05290 [Verrucomicrobia bacterium]|nr:MAG: hypothetical protein DVB32_05290 [Verrucomicrobiota bacterium]
MASPFRNLKKGIRRLLKAETVTIDGVTATTDPKWVSKAVRNGLFKETYEEPERILTRGALTKGDRVLEVGGGVGFVSLICAKICGAENVLTYEANPSMQAVIKKNFELNGLTPQLRSKAITSDGGEATFFISDNIISSSLYEREGGKAQKNSGGRDGCGDCGMEANRAGDGCRRSGGGYSGRLEPRRFDEVNFGIASAYRRRTSDPETKRPPRPPRLPRRQGHPQ